MTTPATAAQPDATAPSDPGVFLPLLPYRRLVVRSVFVVALITAVLTLMSRRTWTARGSFVTQSGRAESLGSLAGLASQFGVNIPSGVGGGFSPRFFSTLVTSDQVLKVVATEPVTLPGATTPTTVEDALEVKGKTPGIRRARTITFLRRSVVSALYDQRDGVTTFSATTRSPELSAVIAKAVVREINRFSAEQLQVHASAERKFVENRRDVVGKELAAAEEQLSHYLTRNREYSASPERKLEIERMSRKISDLERVYSSLTQSFEQARIEEVRDTPVLTIVDPPTPPELPDRRGALQWVVTFAFLTGVFMLGSILVLQRLGAVPVRHTGDAQTFAEWWPILKGDLLHPWRLLF